MIALGPKRIPVLGSSGWAWTRRVGWAHERTEPGTSPELILTDSHKLAEVLEAMAAQCAALREWLLESVVGRLP